MRRLLIMGSLIPVIIIGLSGCAGVLIAGTAAVAGNVATDPRTLGKQLDDQTLNARILQTLRSQQHLYKNTRYRLIIRNGMVVLVGQAPSASLRKQIEKAVVTVAGISVLHNEIRVTPIITPKIIFQDSCIFSKIRSQLLTNKKIKINHVKLIVEDGEVFLYGLVHREEAEIAVAIAQKTQGVKKVIQIFEYLAT